MIHPGSRTLRIGRATDTLPVTVPHVIARRHTQSGQARHEDAWLLREGLNVRRSAPNALTILSLIFCFTMVTFLYFGFISACFPRDRKQRVMSRDKMDSKWLTRLSGPRRCQMGCVGHLFQLNRCVITKRIPNIKSVKC